MTEHRKERAKHSDRVERSKEQGHTPAQTYQQLNRLYQEALWREAQIRNKNGQLLSEKVAVVLERDRLAALQKELVQALERIAGYDVPDTYQMIQIAKAALAKAKEGA